MSHHRVIDKSSNCTTIHLTKIIFWEWFWRIKNVKDSEVTTDALCSLCRETSLFWSTPTWIFELLCLDAKNECKMWLRKSKRSLGRGWSLPCLYLCSYMYAVERWTCCLMVKPGILISTSQPRNPRTLPVLSTFSFFPHWSQSSTVFLLYTGS